MASTAVNNKGGPARDKRQRYMFPQRCAAYIFLKLFFEELYTFLYNFISKTLFRTHLLEVSIGRDFLGGSDLEQKRRKKNKCSPMSLGVTKKKREKIKKNKQEWQHPATILC